MGIEVDISIDDKASKDIESLLAALSAKNRDSMMQVAATAALTSTQEYYQDFDAKGGWVNKSLPTHGPGRKSTGFGNLITEGWNVAKADANGFTLNNGAPWLSSKFKDWVQRPKKTWITIPLVPEAHGVLARDYKGETEFAGNRIVEVLPSGEKRPIYALVKKVKHKAVKGALAPEEVYLKPALDSIEHQINEALGM